MALAQERTPRQGSFAGGPYDPDALVVEVVRRHAQRALSIAHRITESHDDALEAYSRALVKLVDHKTSIRAPTAAAWLFQVVRNEALDVCAARTRLVALEPELLNPLLGPSTADVFERVAERDLHGRAAEALSSLKPDQVRALTLRAAGLSYAEVAAREDWSSTKTHRMIAEGKVAFREALAELESGKACRRWHPVIVGTRDVSARDRARLRVHLRSCAGCRATARAVVEGDAALRVLLPVGLVAAATPGSSRWGTWLDLVADRVTGLAVKAQTSGEALMASKLSVVAASAVAVGGGAVAVQHAARPEDRVVARPHVATVTQRVAALRTTTRATSAVAAAAPSSRSTGLGASASPSTPRSITARRIRAHASDFQRAGTSFEPTSSTATEFGASRPHARSKVKVRAKRRRVPVTPRASSDFSSVPAVTAPPSTGDFGGSARAPKTSSSEFGG